MLWFSTTVSSSSSCLPPSISLGTVPPRRLKLIPPCLPPGDTIIHHTKKLLTVFPDSVDILPLPVLLRLSSFDDFSFVFGSDFQPRAAVSGEQTQNKTLSPIIASAQQDSVRLSANHWQRTAAAEAKHNGIDFLLCWFHRMSLFSRLV